MAASGVGAAGVAAVATPDGDDDASWIGPGTEPGADTGADASGLKTVSIADILVYCSLPECEARIRPRKKGVVDWESM